MSLYHARLTRAPKIKCPGCGGRGFHWGYAFTGNQNDKYPCRRCSGRGMVAASEPERRAKLRERAAELRRKADEIDHRLGGAI